MLSKEFDAMVGAMRFQLIDLWKRQGARNAQYDRVVVDYETRIAELERRMDVLTLNTCGAVSEAAK